MREVEINAPLAVGRPTPEELIQGGAGQARIKPRLARACATI